MVTTAGFTSTAHTDNPLVFTLKEFASVSGTLFDDFINHGKKAIYGVEMLEPAAEGGGVSDFAILMVNSETRIGCGHDYKQSFELAFWSDQAAGFDLALNIFEKIFPDPRTIVEDSTLQTLFCFNGLRVKAASDTVVTPLPTSLLLLGTGILSMAGIGFRKNFI